MPLHELYATEQAGELIRARCLCGWKSGWRADPHVCESDALEHLRLANGEEVC